MIQRVSVYIDGFNLYYGLKEANLQRLFWLDVRRLSKNLLRPNQSLKVVRYFTARVHCDPKDPGKSVRQDTYLEAIATLPEVHTHFGYYLPKQVSCRNCGANWRTFEEKMTDVNISVELLGDAWDDVFDTAIIISGDSDLAGPVEAVRKRFPDKKVIVAFPPMRVSKHLKQIATTSFVIGRKKLNDSQLPTQVTKPDGYVLTRPPAWN